MGFIRTDKIESFKKYSNFTTLSDFNKQIEMFLAVYKKEFTKREFILFRRLTKYCAKVYGVSNASIRTILIAAIKHDFDGKSVSESTFHRMKRKAIRLGILKAKETKRSDGSQSSNLWIFQRYTGNSDKEDTKVQNNQAADCTCLPGNSNHIDSPCRNRGQEEIASHQHFAKREKTSHKTSKHIKTNMQLTSTAEALDYTFVPADVDKSFIDTVKPFYNRAKDIYALWQLVLTAYQKSGLTISINDLQDTVCKAFKTAIFFHKQGKIKKSIKGYFYAVLEDYFNVAFKENLFQNSDIYFDWLDEGEEGY